jgi:hypothetical protein
VLFVKKVNNYMNIFLILQRCRVPRQPRPKGKISFVHLMQEPTPGNRSLNLHWRVRVLAWFLNLLEINQFFAVISMPETI